MKKKKKNKLWTKITLYLILFACTISGVFYSTVFLHLDQPIKYIINGQYTILTETQIETLLKQESQNQGFLFLNVDNLEKKLNETEVFRKIQIEKGDYRTINVFIEEKHIMAKQLQGDKTIAYDDAGEAFVLKYPTNLPIFDSQIEPNDAKRVAQALSSQSSILLQQISEIVYAFVGEARKEMKIVTTQGDVIFVKLEDIKKKLVNFLEIDAIMNKKNVLKCEYHFEYNDANVVVKEIR